MNSVLTLLDENWQRFGLEAYGSPQQLTYVMVTPRFHASSHVVFLILPQDRPQPVLVAKVPRLAGEGETLVREAANLRGVQASREGGFSSVPRVIAFERRWQRPVLIETALAGRALDPPTVRADAVRACQAVMQWLIDVQVASRCAATVDSGWFERLIADPLSDLEEHIALSKEDVALVERTRRVVEPLKRMDIPLVVEHGDLSHPNLLLLDEGHGHVEAGVVDWELAELRGLPACDLFFFLAYVAFARHKARENRRYEGAFREAYSGPDAWVIPYVRTYAQQLRLPAESLAPLFVVTWARYVAGLLARLESAAADGEGPNEAAASWLRRNRYYALWRLAVERVEGQDLYW